MSFDPMSNKFSGTVAGYISEFIEMILVGLSHKSGSARLGGR